MSWPSELTPRHEVHRRRPRPRARASTRDRGRAARRSTRAIPRRAVRMVERKQPGRRRSTRSASSSSSTRHRSPIPAITRQRAAPPRPRGCLRRRAARRLIHVSTDCVFSGSAAGAGRRTARTTCRTPRDLYGRTKLLGEVAEAPALTLRTSIIGRELDRASGLMEWFAAQDGSDRARLHQRDLLRPHDEGAGARHRDRDRSTTRTSPASTRSPPRRSRSTTCCVRLRDVARHAMRDRARRRAAREPRARRLPLPRGDRHRRSPSWDEMLDEYARRARHDSARLTTRSSSSPAAPARSARRSSAPARRRARPPERIIVFSRDEAKQHEMKIDVEARAGRDRRDHLPQLRRADRVPHRRRPRLRQRARRRARAPTSSSTPRR